VGGEAAQEVAAVAVGPVHHGGDRDAAVYHTDSIDLSKLRAAVAGTGPTDFGPRIRARISLILVDLTVTGS
jgi:hypothetical protein